MKWWVWVDSTLVGWVIAADHDTALRHAYVKYPCWGFMTVELKKK